ncbi:hypothetical protein BS47DRAFT_1394413 [Hydnum rufescens UP504]|uniref:Uncharacterized protein n=1 Tax=Hydnum rufescens UP504 TaxID=1448309 RepID=A0A9P6DSL8_9AGAM|nr:hypothetical protein BS47DRAFT_1394413 [Hydnum rufescens UP504]
MHFLSITLLTAALSALSASAECSSSQFSWNKNTDICLPFGHPSTVISPPSGKSCPPEEWYWHPQSSCCVPTKPNPPPPRCGDGLWDEFSQCCNSGGNPPPPVPTHRWGHGGKDKDGGKDKGGDDTWWKRHDGLSKGDKRRAAQKSRTSRN